MRRTVSLTLLAAALGVGSFRYPLGHDQSVHAYVAREWIARGALPYRDTFDHKTPGIFVAHALSEAAFGFHSWSIRPLELVTVLGMGLAVAALGRWKHVGAGALAVAFLYYGFFTYLDTAQPDLWATAAATFAVLAARKERFATSGLLAGVALLMKPPIATLIVIAIYEVWRRRDARARTRFGVGAIAIPALVVGYFFAHGGASAMFEVLGHANGAYLRCGVHRKGLGHLVDCNGEMFGALHPISTLLLAGVAVRFLVLRRAHGKDWHFALLMLAAGYLAMLVQLKFMFYHAVTLLPGLGLLLGCVARSLTRRVRGRNAAGAVVALVAVLTYPLAGRRARGWWSATRSVVLGKTDVYASAGGRSQDATESRAVAAWIQSHSSPDDLVAVRGFHAEIYMLSERRYGGRFFWSGAYAGSLRGYAGAERWREEDRQAFANHPPRFVVATDDPGRSGGRVDFDGPGYTLATRIGAWAIYERAASSGRLEAAVRINSPARERPSGP